jgi:hypothetical protein
LWLQEAAEVAVPINVEAGVRLLTAQTLNKANQVPTVVAAAATIFVAVCVALPYFKAVAAVPNIFLVVLDWPDVRSLFHPMVVGGHTTVVIQVARPWTTVSTVVVVVQHVQVPQVLLLCQPVDAVWPQQYLVFLDRCLCLEVVVVQVEMATIAAVMCLTAVLLHI